MAESPRSSSFMLSAEDTRKIRTWNAEIAMPAAVEKQKKGYEETGNIPSEFVVSCWESGQPYGGAIGGSLEYCFTPTSLGMVLIVKDSISGLELNLTDYDSW